MNEPVAYITALELADELENLYNRFLPAHSKFLDILKSATMLRQQQQRLTKYELRHVVQRDTIAILEAQLKKASEK